MEIIEAIYKPSRDPCVVDYTRNVRSDDLRYLARSNADGFFSKDEIGLSWETVTNNIIGVWRVIGQQPPTIFTSLAVRVAEARATTSLSAYGNVVLIIDAAKIANETYIVNGDFKSLGAYVQTGHINASDIRVLRPNDQDIAGTLNKFAREGRTPKSAVPRLLGTYFEARVTRGIRLEDVVTAYVPRGDRQTIRDLENLQQ